MYYANYPLHVPLSIMYTRGCAVKNSMVRIALFTLKAILASGVILNVFLSFIGVLKKSKSKGNQLDKIWWLLESQTCRIFGGELM